MTHKLKIFQKIIFYCPGQHIDFGAAPGQAIVGGQVVNGVGEVGDGAAAGPVGRLGEGGRVFGQNLFRFLPGHSQLWVAGTVWTEKVSFSGE